MNYGASLMRRKVQMPASIFPFSIIALKQPQAKKFAASMYQFY